MKQNVRLGAPEPDLLVGILALPPASQVSLGNLLEFSLPQSPAKKNAAAMT